MKEILALITLSLILFSCNEKYELSEEEKLNLKGSTFTYNTRNFVFYNGDTANLYIASYKFDTSGSNYTKTHLFLFKSPTAEVSDSSLTIEEKGSYTIDYPRININCTYTSHSFEPSTYQEECILINNKKLNANTRFGVMDYKTIYTRK